ncbi:UDP-glucosyltransferase, putative [Ricinus communis]|uniref:UDP-glucosyltransferase, putative n=1 Tax=Ricinus communis TaxID=3988 RepID=B9RQ32_RICCO|nr:UDP-glucosyltransferase, putative [Ricinus communis]
MAQGHMIPMIDIAKLLAKRGVIITIVTTPVNAARFKKTLARAQESDLSIRIIQLQFPCEESGLPKGCENIDLLPSSDIPKFMNFFTAANMLQEQVEILFQELMPRPSCIISDLCLPYTSHVACFFCAFVLSVSIMMLLKALIPLIQRAADLASFGVVINSFEELEPEYVEEYKKVRGGKVSCVGPVSLCNKDILDKAQRGNDASIAEHECLKWLDSQEPGSVVYVCLGSLCNVPPSQLVELGLGLEESEKPFLWVIRRNEKSKEIEKWILETGFEERIKGRGVGFLIHGFAPQVLKAGVSVGVERPMEWGEEEKIGILVKKEDVKKAVDMLMDEGEEGQARRERAKEIGNMAKRAVEEGGSSYRLYYNAN